MQLNVVNGVSISEDVKPLAGLPGLGNMNYPSTSPGPLVKHICAICGDRSSGTCPWWSTPGGWGLGGRVLALLAQTGLAAGPRDLECGGGDGDCSGSSKAPSSGRSSWPHTVVLGRPGTGLFFSLARAWNTHIRGRWVQRGGGCFPEGVLASLSLTLGKCQ